MLKLMQNTLLKESFKYSENKYFYVIDLILIFIMIDFKEGKIWQKLKELTEEPDKKEVIQNLEVKEEEELNKLGKNNPLITFFIYFNYFLTVVNILSY